MKKQKTINNIAKLEMMRRTLRRWMTIGTILVVVAAVFILPRILGDIAYPVKYEIEINAAAIEFSIEPALLFALVRSESNFRPTIRSHAGAVGLAQLLPSTAAWVAGRIGLTNYSSSMLEDPAVNARLGAAYLRYLLDKYDQREDLALMGYNGGPGAVGRYLTNGTLPRETNRYYQVVLDRRDKYVDVLAEQTAVQPTEEVEQATGVKKAFLQWFNN